MAKRNRQQQAKKEQVGPGTLQPTTAAAAPEAKGMNLEKIKVIATRMGYYQHKRRREGDVFFLVPLRSVKRAEQADCDKDPKLTIGMVLKDPKTKQTIPCIIPARQQFSDKWMEEVDADVRTSITSVKEGMRKEHDKILLDKYPQLAGGDDEEEGDDPAADSGEGDDDNVVTGDTEVL